MESKRSPIFSFFKLFLGSNYIWRISDGHRSAIERVYNFWQEKFEIKLFEFYDHVAQPKSEIVVLIFVEAANLTIFFFVQLVTFLANIASSGDMYFADEGHFISMRPSLATSPSDVPPRKYFSLSISKPHIAQSIDPLPSIRAVKLNLHDASHRP